MQGKSEGKGSRSGRLGALNNPRGYSGLFDASSAIESAIQFCVASAIPRVYNFEKMGATPKKANTQDAET